MGQSRAKSTRTVALVATILLAIHLASIFNGGLLDPAETALAESGRALSEGSTSCVTPIRPTPGNAIVPPMASWLSSLGVSVFGNSTFGARAFASIISALLIIGCFMVLSRLRGDTLAGALCLAVVVTPLWLFNCGQVSSSTLAAGSTLLVLLCLASVSTAPQQRTRSYLMPVVLGVALGSATLAGGPPGAALPLLSILVFLLIDTEDNGRQPSKRWIIALIVAVLGAALFAFSFFDDRCGWPTAASLGRLGCGETGDCSAWISWVGVVIISAAVVVWKAGAARRLGLHIAIPLFAAVAAPWYVTAFLSSDAATICSALQEEASRPWPSNTEIAQTVRMIGYGLYPWMAFLPLSILRLTARQTKDNQLALWLFIFVAASLGLTLSGALPTQPLLVTTTILIAALILVGLASGHRHDAGNLRDRAACLVGAMLLAIVFRDLVREPDVLPALGLPISASSQTVIGASLVPIIVGSFSLFALLLLAMEGAEIPKRFPSIFRKVSHNARRLAVIVVVGTMVIFTLVNLTSSSRRLASAVSWSDVFRTYAEEQRAGDELYGWRDVGSGGRFYAGREMVELERARGLRRALQRHEGRTFFATETTAYRQLSEMVNRITGERIRPLNRDKQHHILALYDGPNLDAIERPDPLVTEVPPHARRDRERLSRSVQLIGSTISSERAHPGDTVTVVLYLRCIRSMREDHQIRLQLRPRRGRWSHTEDHDPTDDLMPTSSWRSDQIVVDSAELIIPNRTEPERYTLSVELIGAGGGRRDIGRLEIE